MLGVLSMRGIIKKYYDSVFNFFVEEFEFDVF